MLTPLKAIRALCLRCTGNSTKAVRECSRRIAQVGLTGWVEIRSLPVVRIGVLS